MKHDKFMNRHILRNTHIALFVCMFILLSCEKKDNKKDEEAYDPKKPIELTSFYPDSGRYLEKVLLTGKNFGSDPEQIRVWFNNRRAAVVGSTGSRMYVLAPRLPGDTCVISVVIGNDSVVYDSEFRYFTSVTVTTIAGNGNDQTYRDGDLGQSLIHPWYVCVDKEDNVFVMSRSTTHMFDANLRVIARVNEMENSVGTISRGGPFNAPCADPETGVITFPTETTIGSFITLDPKEMWAARIREMKWPPAGDRPTEGWKHCMVVNPSDGYIYTRYYHGHIVKIHPKTFEVETIYKTEQGDSYGLTFNPLHPNIMYMALWSNSGVNANSICSIDVTNPQGTFKKLSGSSSGGHRDGPLEVAQFLDPAQIFCDADGNVYVADSGNHCIRRITPDNMVETILGMPGTAGWKDGGKEEALFNTPRGIGIGNDGSVYVGDAGNARLRKLSIN